MPKTRIVRSYQAGKRSEEIPILKECNCLETITKEEYELLKEALNG